MERPEAHVRMRGNGKSTWSLPELHLAGLEARWAITGARAMRCNLCHIIYSYYHTTSTTTTSSSSKPYERGKASKEGADSNLEN